MDTKHRILDEALTLFSQKGYANVYVGEIAEKVGIKAPSLYKHYKNKQAIFDAIIDEMNKRYEAQAGMLNINGMNPSVDASVYSNISDDRLVEIGIGLFLYFLHDDYTCRFRKILTIEQFHNQEFSKIYSSQYVDGPISYQKMLFQLLMANGEFISADVDVMTLQFYAPIYMLLTLCDREPDREAEALKLLEKHFRQFSKIYGGAQ
ncbi:MAG: TetR/AcrR family transcriptional regulator [Lachnospiraceae bacterium]|nr:TetR/AcrR family transcriptional regulator [Lachnospiraceae bacterium]